jgi:hypothetical protein
MFTLTNQVFDGFNSDLMISEQNPERSVATKHIVVLQPGK